ncbi:MAG: phosphatase PAP2 family protein [Crocinitomicaceae bacterium]
MQNNKSSIFSSARIRALAIWGPLGAFGCVGIYLLTNEIASRNTEFYHLFFEFEREIPMVPWMIHIYNSFHLLLLLNFICIKSPLQIRALAISLISSCGIAALFFLIFPTELGFSRTQNIIGYEFWYNQLHLLDHPHNLVPSLHITFSALSASVIAKQTESRLLKGAFLIWFLLICSSIILVHQHHLLDLLTGFILAVIVKKFIYDRLLKSKLQQLSTNE